MMLNASRALVFVYTSLVIYLVLLLGLVFDMSPYRDIEVSNRNSNADHLSTLQPSTQMQQQQQSSVQMMKQSSTKLPREGSLLCNSATKPVAAAALVKLDARSSSTKSATNWNSIKDVRVDTNETYEDWSKRINSKEHMNKIVNPHPFKYILDNPHICDDRDIFLLAFVLTAFRNFQQRNFIRQTWGSASNYDVKVRVIFVLGRAADSAANRALQHALQLESDSYGDIVQKDFVDTYYNLTHKSISGLRWIDERCSHARWVLKIDDDVFLNGFNLIRHLQRQDKLEIDERKTAESRHGSMNLKRSTRGQIICFIWNRMRVGRSWKWKVDKETWPDEYFPNFCSGVAYIMTPDVAVSLHRASYSVPFLWLEDVYLTGIVAGKLGKLVVRLIDFKSAYLLISKNFIDKFTGPQRHQYVFSHGPDNLKTLQKVWKTIRQTEWNS